MASKIHAVSWEELDGLLDSLEFELAGKVIFGVPRGGAIVAGLVRQRFPTREIDITLTEDPGVADVILDDVIETGETIARYVAMTRRIYTPLKFIALFNKITNPELVGTWIHFPWERKEEIPKELVRFGYDQ